MSFKPTSPDELDKRIDLQAPIGSPVVWKSMLPTGTLIWAAIWPTSANEVVQANATVMVISHRIRIRYRSVMKAGWRVKFGNRSFNIVSILNPNESNDWLDLMTKEAAG